MLQSQSQILLNSSSSQKEALIRLFTLLDNKNRTLIDVLDTMPCNETVANNIIKAWSIINRPTYKKILCSVSGGSDSDLLVDICARCDVRGIVEYVFCDTGLESVHTKNHLTFLEEKYGIKIIRKRAIKPIPLSVREYGVPFLNKNASEYMMRLQMHGFKWEDEPLEVLLKRYCKVADEEKARELEEKSKTGQKIRWAKVNGVWYFGCVSALQWWCNSKYLEEGKSSQFDIAHNPYLKEFILQNPPDFKIANKCCLYAKKKVVHELLNDDLYDLSISGVRKAEGGARATAYKNCFTSVCGTADTYRPVFWYTDNDKKEYNEYCGIQNSMLYSKEFGLRRTGCTCCPFALGLEHEKECFRKNEPNMYKAVMNVFGKSYDYTDRYKAFAKEQREKKRSKNANVCDINEYYEQMSIFDFIS